MGLFDRFQYIPGQAKDTFVRNGLIVLGVFAVVVYFMYTGGRIPFVPQSGYTVTADFTTAANVTPGKTPVRVAGVKVGEVSSVKRLPDGRGVQIKMRITDKGVKLRSDARAHIYWRTLLGFAFYVELDQGSDPAPLKGPIQIANTDAQVELDQVLASLTPPSREGIQTMLREFDKGFNGQTQSGRTLDELGPAMKQIGPGLEGLRGVQPGDLQGTIKSTSQLMGQLAQKEVDLGDLVTNGNTTLGVTAARRAEIGNILDDAPSTLDVTTKTVVRLRSTLDKLDPVADQLRPGVREIAPTSFALKPALDQLNPTLDDLRPTLKNLRPALRRVRSASRAGTPFLKNIEPALDNANNTILPGLEVKGETGRKAYQVIGPTIAAVSDSSALYDAYGYSQAFNAVSSSGRALAFLPCSVDINKGVKCNDVNAVLNTLLGLNPKPGASAGAATASKSSGGSPAGGSAGGAVDVPASKETVKHVTDYIQGVL